MEGVIQEINKGALELFGYNKDELIGKREFQFFLQVNCYSNV
jgi:PAS domain S-box